MPNPTPSSNDIDTLYLTIQKYNVNKLSYDELIALIGDIPLLFNLLTASIQHTDTTHYSIIKQCIFKIATEHSDTLKSENLIQYYTYGLKFTDEQIRTYTIELITLLTKTDSQWLTTHNTALFDLLCSMLVSDDSLSVVTALHKLFDTVQDKSILYNKLSQQIQTFNLQNIDNKQIIALLRVYEVLINLAINNDTVNQQLNEHNTIESLLQLYDKLSIDPLSRLNVLEFIQSYVTQSRHVTIEQQQNIVSHIVQSIDLNDAMSNLIIGPVFDLIDKITTNSYKLNQSFEFTDTIVQQLLHIFTQLLNDRTADDTIVAQCISCMSSIATTYTGLQTLLQHNLLYRISEYASNTSDILKLASLHSIELILHTLYKTDTQTDVMSIKQQLFNNIGIFRQTSTMSILQPMLKLPFEELKLKAYSVCEAVAELPFGITALVQAPGFIEFLVNRNNDVTINGQTAKYSVVNALINNPLFHTINTTVQQQLMEYKNTGRYALEQQSRVMDPVYNPA